jgi:precorrin-6A/cobalt-precorrin-6A reductase
VTSILLLAGTSEAAELAGRLHSTPGLNVVASFAGRVAQPKPLPCTVRIGGFGGAEGLAGELRRAGHDLLIDATHPFAARMAANAEAAARATGVPRLRLLRPPWVPEKDDDWHDVDDMDAAAEQLATLGARVVFLATGRHEVESFARLTATRFVLRAIDPPDPLPLAAVDVVLDRGPFAVESETSLLRHHGVDAIVTRNSGGRASAAKLAAARTLRIPVVMVRRPPPPPGEQVETADEAIAWVAARRATPMN